MRHPRNSSLTSGLFLCVLAALAALAGCGEAEQRGRAAAGRTLFVGRRTVEVSAFETAAPIRAEHEAELVKIFDQSRLPSGYKTCHAERKAYEHLRIVRPYNKAAFPRNIAPPKFRWEDQTNNLWMLIIKAPGWASPLRVVTDRTEWRPDFRTWEEIKASGTSEWIQMEVRGCTVEGNSRVGDKVYADAVKFRVSKYPADPLIVYRSVSPLFHGLKTPNIYYRDISTFETRMFLPGKHTYCTNCHSFPPNPAIKPEDMRLAIAVRSQMVSATGGRILGLYKFANREGATLNINSFFMSWNPEGTKVAVTGGDFVIVRPGITLETQEFYVLVADILIVDAKTQKVNKLPGACEPEYMESFPTWSPDGKWIVFARADEIDAKHYAERRFSVYKVPYNDGEGGKAEPLPGAADNEMSNFAPRFSPDGKWIVFNKADWSSLVAPTAHLWITPADGSSLPRTLECNSEYDEEASETSETPFAMDSHHSWSSNSRWLLFASKRDDGIFARIYMTEIDEKGHASPPVELPTLEDTMMCYNVPEFLKCKVAIDADDILAKTSTLKH